MIKYHLGVISPGGLNIQYVYMAFDFHDVTTGAKICAFNFVCLSTYCPPSLRYSLLNLEDAVDLPCSDNARRRVKFGSVPLNFAFCSIELH